MKKLKLFQSVLVVTLAFFAFTSCSTASKTTTSYRSDKAYIIIKRPAFVGAMWAHFMELNDIDLGQVKGGDCIRIEVDPGLYVLNYYNTVKLTTPTFRKSYDLKSGDIKYLRIVIHPVEITCQDEDSDKGFGKVNQTIDFAVLQKMHKPDDTPVTPVLAQDEPNKKVQGLGDTALENMVIRWDVQSRPQGADLFWRVVSKTPEVKSTNSKYLMTTPYEATKSLDIKGLTYQTSGDVRIILRCEKDGYLPQEKEFDVRMILDQEEISAFFRLVKE